MIFRLGRSPGSRASGRLFVQAGLFLFLNAKMRKPAAKIYMKRERNWPFVRKPSMTHAASGSRNASAKIRNDA